ncbi:hypothetical protein HDU76_013108 [Blyttiomyces sp. JEL0837]|nr:hypothetical protein HDU76_013108 [Blyttiomyces sp. JEL0837]
MADSVMGGGASTLPNIPALYPSKKPRTIGPFERFAISAAAPAIAVVFTNPFDTAKVRLQLQVQRIKKMKSTGEAIKTPQMVYKNTFDTIWKIFKYEGISGLQKGLTPAILREGSKNLFRIGMYDPIMALIHDPSKGSAPPWKRMLAGSICGMMGAFSCNPFELVKTRLQSQITTSSSSAVAVGHQHQYRGVWDGLYQIVKLDGVKGLYRGSVLSMGRSMVGSGMNLSSYSLTKEYLIVGYGFKDDWILDMIAGMNSGVVACLFMNPIDVVRTRYYNQEYVNGKGVIYSSGFDAMGKIFREEGFGAFYKGFTTHFLRIGPHFCLTFVFLGVLRRELVKTYKYLDMRDSFKSFDTDGNGVLDSNELASAMRKVIPPPSDEPIKDAEYEKMINDYTMRIFSTADENNDRLISFQEYQKATEEFQKIVVEQDKMRISKRSMKSFAD